ncbi:MAG: aspartate aminotransferase family protein [Acidimicrobiales bacterium]
MTPRRTDHYPFLPGTTPPMIVGAEGSHLITADGRRILDAAGGAVVTNIGHGRPEPMEAAVTAPVDYVVPTWATESRLELIERLQTAWLPSGVVRCMFVTGGSEAVDAAVRIARLHQVAAGRPARWKVLGQSVSYHGATLGTLAVANHDRRRAHLDPLLPDQPKWAAFDIGDLADLIDREDPASVAAVVLEPVSGASGAALTPPPGYLVQVRELCREHGIVMIADEVMTGFGRTGAPFAVDHEAVVPDLLVGGKGLGGGYAPIGLVAATEELVAPIAAAGLEVMYHTFSASEISCRVANTVLRIMETERLVDRAAAMGERLAAALTAAAADHPHVAEVRGLGLLRGVELVADRASGAGFGGRLTPLVVAEALARGVWIYPAGSGPVPDGLLFGPPFTITNGEIDEIATVTVAAVDAAVATLAAAGGPGSAAP